METKKCGKCDNVKSVNDFNKSKRKGGLSFLCKVCHSEYRKEHYKKNKEKVIAQVNEYRFKHPEKYENVQRVNGLNNPNKKAGRVLESNCCVCQSIIFVSKKDLLTNKEKYCSKECRYKNNKSPYHHYLRGIKKRAEAKKIEFDLTEEFIKELLEVSQNNKCSITNCPIKIKNSGETTLYDTASLDRIDSKLGYIKGNVQWVMLGINYLKLDFDINELHKTLKLIKENYNT